MHYSGATFRINTSSRRLGRASTRARVTPETRYDRRKGSSANSTRSSMLDETCLIPAVADSSQNPQGPRVIAFGPKFRATGELIYHSRDNFFPSPHGSSVQGRILFDDIFMDGLHIHILS